MIASASFDKTIKLWSVEGHELQTLFGHSAAVDSVTFSPDGTMIASASRDKTVIVWALDLEKLEQSASLWRLDLQELLVRGCDWLRNYLKHNSSVEESDRFLCPCIKKD
jgi:WD40 repeat protein